MFGKARLEGDWEKMHGTSPNSKPPRRDLPLRGGSVSPLTFRSPARTLAAVARSDRGISVLGR